MHRITASPGAAALLLVCVISAAEPQSDKPDPALTWDLTELFPTKEAWDGAREQVLSDLQKIDARRGTLGDGAESLYRTMALVSDTTRDALRVYAYASLLSDEDLRVTETQEMNQLGDIMYARFTEATAWIQPELLDVGREVIDAYIKEDERLERFAFQLDNGLRNAPHTLGDEAEETLAYFTQTFGAANNIYSIVANSDIPWPTVTLSSGEGQRIDSQGYSRWRASGDRDDRKKVFDAYWSKWLEYRNSVGSILNSHVQAQVSLARARNYDSVLDRELFQDNLPPGVVLIDDLYANEWMFVPHFYYNMYVFQYATSQTAGTALYEKIRNEGRAGVENYKNLLRAGGSDYPYNLLTAAGVDLATPEPYRAAVRKMNAIMDEMESLLEERER
jgi:oligoendopeptidase F